MTYRALVSAAATLLLAPVSAFADEAGFFAGLDAAGGIAFGSSDTTDGGAAFAGGGVVENVKLGKAAGIGGHAGYRFDSPLSAFVSYQYVRGDVSWDARYPLFGIASNFEGTAVSHVLMGNLAYDFALSDATSLRTTAGLGLSFNTLSSVVEADAGTGLFLADLAEKTKVSPAAQVGAGIQHKLTDSITWGLSTSVSYSGSFETGTTRNGNLGVTPINPYKIDDVWRVNLGTSIRFRF
ncbi:outer membrane beta-barrel protein [Shinella zoogloeoides]|uniref:Outer membrane beta-barrel protein n=1 Tax=Shinella zoogloeoides TaxID=352475 RepID=A0A6N8TKF4_SHIZO|nr:outer membrane beta-barrel protein [Shinella zoogloeoides]MXO02895.1 outer membrane beta-barrel protein [Shinella zoogloeoides]UEX81855.1 porin family protein [Shinella zoogloeoides]